MPTCALFFDGKFGPVLLLKLSKLIPELIALGLGHLGPGDFDRVQHMLRDRGSLRRCGGRQGASKGWSDAREELAGQQTGHLLEETV